MISPNDGRHALVIDVAERGPSVTVLRPAKRVKQVTVRACTLQEGHEKPEAS
jgi:hypothetical protein